MKKRSSLIVLLILLTVFASCTSAETEVVEEEPVGEAVEEEEVEEVTKKAAFITESPLGNPFTDLIWSGFEALESEGWEVKVIEALDSAEYAESIRALAGDGYSVIMTFADAVSNVAVDLADEIYELYPETRLFLLDTYMEHGKPNCTSVSVDPFESSFVAGFVAAKTTETGTIGWIGHTDILKIRRFRDGYIAGAAYANPDVEVVYSFTGDYLDPNKGLEAGAAMIANYPVDIIYQSCYLAGPGVIEACANGGIRCIGVDDWQGNLDPSVFWSAIKPMDNAVITLASKWAEGYEFPLYLDFNIGSGGRVYDERDFEKLSPELQAEVLQLVEDIRTGEVDVYEGFEEYRLDY
ncbi:MAG TPA: BMP family ABC transporter substrate-binding protein [Anaerolineaceae bacterium]|nr:BMP family ABC transporter substrate-binding protein [Anaerolineaceae bacterium]